MSFIIALDYDGTIFEGTWPELGSPKKDVIKKIKELKKHGAEIILWTCREGKSLQEAISRCNKEGLEFDSINENCPSQKEIQYKTLKEDGDIYAIHKIYADLYVDDKSPGSIDYLLSLKISDIKNN